MLYLSAETELLPRTMVHWWITLPVGMLCVPLVYFVCLTEAFPLVQNLHLLLLYSARAGSSPSLQVQRRIIGQAQTTVT